MTTRNIFTALTLTTVLTSPAHCQGLAAQGIDVGSANWLNADNSNPVDFDLLENSKQVEVLERVDREIQQIYQPGKQFARLSYQTRQVPSEVEPKIRSAALEFEKKLDKPVLDKNFPTIRGWFNPIDINRDGLEEFVIINTDKRYVIIGRILDDEVKILFMQSWTGFMNQVLFTPVGVKQDFIFNGLQETFAAIYIPESDIYLSEAGLKSLQTAASSTALVSPTATRGIILYKTPVDDAGNPASLRAFIRNPSMTVGYQHINSDWVIEKRFDKERGSNLAQLNGLDLGGASIDSYYGVTNSKETYPLNQYPLAAGIQTKTYIKVDEKQTINFGVRAAPISMRNPCTSTLSVNGKVLKTTNGDTPSIQETRTFPKGEFVIEASVVCDPIDADKIRTQPGALDVYGAAVRNWYHDPLLRSVDFYITDENGEQLPTYERTIFDRKEDDQTNDDTTGVIYISSDKGSITGEAEKVFYDFATPIKIVDFGQLKPGTIVDEAQTSFEFNFTPSEVGEYSLNLQTLSNLCFRGTGCVDRPHNGSGIYRTYHPATEIVVRDRNRVLASKSKFLLSSRTPVANSRMSFMIASEDVGRELTINVEVLHNSTGSVEMNSYNDDFIIMDVLNQSGLSAHFINDDPLDIPKLNSGETGVLFGNSLELHQKGVLPMLTAQLTVRPPTSDRFRFFRGSEISSPFIKPSRTLSFDLEQKPVADNGDTSWLD